MDLLQERLQDIVQSFKKVLQLNNPMNLQPDFISHHKIDAYGSRMLLKELASIGKVDNSTLEIKPFDVQLIKNIEQVLWNSKKGTVVNKKTCLLFKLPTLTKDAIESLVKSCKTLLEDFKQKVKIARHNHLDEFKKEEKDKNNISKETDRIQVFVNDANQNLQKTFKDFYDSIIGK